MVKNKSEMVRGVPKEKQAFQLMEKLLKFTHYVVDALTHIEVGKKANPVRRILRNRTSVSIHCFI